MPSMASAAQAPKYTESATPCPLYAPSTITLRCAAWRRKTGCQFSAMRIGPPQRWLSRTARSAECKSRTRLSRSARSSAARPSACCDGVGSHEVTLSRLNHAACMLPVYASRPQLPTARATLGSGCGPALPDGIGYPLGSSEKFPSSCHHYMTFPFPRLVLAQARFGPKPCGRGDRRIQTTGWLQLITEYKDGIGVSLDGPAPQA